MPSVKVGIAGFGVVGRRRRDCIERHPHMQVVAVCDQAFDGEGMLPDGTRYFRDYRRLLEEGLDALIVCLTNDIAAEVTIAGLESGLHVFCEKPPGPSVEDIVRVIAHERRHPSLKLMYGFNHRYHESGQESLAIMRSGELGGFAGTRAGRRVTKTRAPALRAFLAPACQPGRHINSLRSDNVTGLPRPGSPALGGVEGKKVKSGSSHQSVSHT